VKLVMTLLARDEEDILDAQLAFHLHAGVDFVIATDNRSQDGTTAILERHAREGHLHLIRNDEHAYDQSAWVTRMARLAATEFEADWVINSDADEFWWPRGGDLKEVLAATPARYGILPAPIRHFFLRLGDGHFAERMVYRPLLTAPVNEPNNPLRPNTHVLHRADPAATVNAGNHALQGSRHVRLSGWYPVECLHFPLRSVEQAERKYLNWVDSLAGREYRDAFDAHEKGELDAFVRDKILADDVLERGVADGSLLRDTRLRDALRALAGREPLGAAQTFETSGVHSFARPTVLDDVGYAAETAVLAEADAVRLQRRLDELEPRIALLERRKLRFRLGAAVDRSHGLVRRVHDSQRR
jgi:glycosyl transferase family 2